MLNYKSIPSSVKKQFDLTEQTALITGGAGYLGQQFAQAIAEMGGRTVLVDINQTHLYVAEEILNNAGFSDCSSYVVDLTNEKDCKKTFNIIRARVTFAIDPSGIIRYVHSSQLNMKGHIHKTLKAVARLK